MSHDINMETFSPILGGLTLDFLHKRSVMQNFDIFFIVSLNKLLDKMSNCQWFAMHNGSGHEGVAVLLPGFAISW